MKKYLIALAIFINFSCFSQKKFEIKKIGFSMNSPKEWYEMKDEETLKNLEEYDLTKEQVTELLKTNTKHLVTYTKYNPKKVAGIIPTIKVRTMETQSKTIENFIKGVALSTEDAMKALDNFRYTEKPVAVKVSGKNAVKFAVQFTMKNNGIEYEIVSNSYYILLDGFYVSLNFIEQVGKEDNSKLFDEIFQSIQFTK